MKIVDRLKAAGRAFRGGEYWEMMLANPESVSGASVSYNNSLSLSAVWSAMILITETMSTIPLQLFRRTDDGRELLRDNQLYGILHDRANRIENAQSFRETFQWNLEMRGIGLAEIVRNGRGIAELWNINPEDLQEVRRVGTSLEFDIGNMVFPQDKIFYCYGPGRKGLTPRGRLEVARDAVGLGLSMQTYGGRYFRNGTNVGTIIEHPAKLGDAAYKRLKESLDSKHMGAENAHKNMILEEGMKFSRANLSNEDSQFLESRKFQISDIARFFGVKNHMIGDLERATFSNIEQQGIEAVTYCWRPRAVRIEQSINQQLVRGTDVYAEHNMNGLMQGDLKSQAESWHVLLQDGVLNANEVRGMLNMNNQPGEQGDIYFFPMNMQDKDSSVEDIDDARGMVAKAARAAMDNYGLRFNSEEYKKSAKSIISALESRGYTQGEDIRIRNALKLSAMQASGVKKIMWRSEPDCPHCQHLNGKSVTAGEPFEGKVKHPPLTDGCTCSIVDCDIMV
jgi:HK97 family phage portal protein